MATTKEISKAVNEYLAKGGKIIKLPAPKRSPKSLPALIRENPKKG